MVHGEFNTRHARDMSGDVYDGGGDLSDPGKKRWPTSCFSFLTRKKCATNITAIALRVTT